MCATPVSPVDPLTDGVERVFWFLLAGPMKHEDADGILIGKGLYRAECGIVGIVDGVAGVLRRPDLLGDVDDHEPWVIRRLDPILNCLCTPLI